MSRARPAGHPAESGAGPRLRRAFYARPVLEVARDLLGRVLVHDTDEGACAGAIVETEAYAAADPGSHAARGMTPRNAPMFETPGIAYVYFTYGMHYCFNVVTDRDGVAGAVLVRAVQPLHGLDLMRQRRGPAVRDRDLARGPARLTQAFAIGRAHNRADLVRSALRICAGSTVPDAEVATTPRIGLGRLQDGRAWRFVVAGSPWVSRGPYGDTKSVTVAPAP